MEKPPSIRPLAAERSTTSPDTETVIHQLINDETIRDLAEEIRLEELRLGLQLRPQYQALYERGAQAVRGLNHAVLHKCSGKHGRWGRICVLDASHDAADMHWGINAAGQPIAWIGSAPDDD